LDFGHRVYTTLFQSTSQMSDTLCNPTGSNFHIKNNQSKALKLIKLPPKQTW